MLTQVEKDNLFEALYMWQATANGDGTVQINYIDDTAARKPLSELSEIERDRVLSIYSEQISYSLEFGAQYIEKARLGDGRTVEVNKSNRASFQDSLSGEKYRRILLSDYQSSVNFEEPRADLDFSWLRTNYSNYINAKNELIEFWKKVHRKKTFNSGFNFFDTVSSAEVAPYPTEEFLKIKLWDRLPNEYKNQVIAEDIRRSALNSGDNGILSQAAGFIANPTLAIADWSFKNPTQAAIAVAVVATAGQALSALPSVTIPTASQLGQTAAAALVTEGTKRGQELINQLAAPKKEQQQTAQVEPIQTAPQKIKVENNDSFLVIGSLVFLAFALGV